MSLSIKITNTACQAGCVYCYEHFIRDKGPAYASRPLNLDAVLAQMDKEWAEQTRMAGSRDPGAPYLHGGEALTAGHEVVETIMRKAWELAGHTNIQTYGYLIDKRYIEIFKRYNAHVGISIDGPWPLNRARVVPGRSTKEITELVHRNILWLRSEGISVSIICVLHKLNAVGEARERLKEWILWLKDIGVNAGRLNLMHSDHYRYGKALELTEEEAEEAWRDLTRFVLIENDDLFWQPMHDAVSSVLGLEQGTCVFGACPYYHAHSEPVILSDGHTANCLKTAKEGFMYPRYEQYDGDFRGFGGIRYDVLPLIDREDGGCKGCPFWRNCMGGCPSEGLYGDWRNRTRFCKAYYGLFDEAAKYLKRLIPNLVLTHEAPDSDFKHNMGIQSMDPPAFRYMLRQYTTAPSSWRGEAKSAAIKRIDLSQPPAAQRPRGSQQGSPAMGPRDGWPSQHEHIDGDLRHLDSSAGGRENGVYGHIDGNIYHLDSGPSFMNQQAQAEGERQKVIRERLGKSNQTIKELKKQ